MKLLQEECELCGELEDNLQVCHYCGSYVCDACYTDIGGYDVCDQCLEGVDTFGRDYAKYLSDDPDMDDDDAIEKLHL